MNVDVITTGRVLTVNLKGEIDHHTAGKMREEIDSEIERRRPARLKLNFEGISFMDSSGIAVIIKVSRRMRTLGGRAWIEEPARQPQRVIDAAGIDRLVPVAMKR